MEGSEKTIYSGGGGWLKRGVWTICRFKGGGGVGKKKGVFLRGGGGVDTPMHTMYYPLLFYYFPVFCSNGAFYENR